MHQKALQDAESTSEALLSAAREEADQIKREATPARLRALEEENAQLREEIQRWSNFVSSVRSTLASALGDQWAALRQKINETWKADPRNPDHQPEPASQSCNSGPPGP